MSAITTHVLDTARGRPAGGVGVALDVLGADGAYHAVGKGTTDADGRARALLPPETPLEVGTYRLTFATGAYFQAAGIDGFYPEVTISFFVRDATQHHHVPLLLNPYGYSTYRGS